jgi:hypothetical protein
LGDGLFGLAVSIVFFPHLARDAGHDLVPFPAVSAWLERVRQQAGWFALE